MNELPFQTYERLTGERWPGGRSDHVVLLLKLFKIKEAPGSNEANQKLQHALLMTEAAF